MKRKKLTSARSALIKTLPKETSTFGGPVELRYTHVPASHAKALHPNTQLVIGMRGAGKSFWWAALQRNSHRALVAELAPRAGLTEQTKIAVGFGEAPNPSAYPGRDVLRSLVDSGYEPRLIWLTVVLHALSDGRLTRADSWQQRVDYVSSHPGEVEQALFEYDKEYESKRTYWIILFDALDRSASDWRTMNALIRGLLQAMLDLRPYRRLRAKSFLRTDQMDEHEVANFPDASKVLAGSVDLSWPSTELYCLLFQYLGNSDDGRFRKEVTTEFRFKWRKWRSVWLPPRSLQQGGDDQKKVFHAITGPWMGRDHRRGYPYTWVPNHLADAELRTSPRSFVAALRTAAEDSEDRYRSHTWPIHYESIKRGVQKASEIRVQELQEDYPWVDLLMEPLRGKVVPCLFDEISEAWRKAGALEHLQHGLADQQQQFQKLPPAHLLRGADGVRRDLEQLGIFLRLRDGRVNIPDVFRVGYGLGRRGGVHPIRPGDTR